MAKVSTIKTNIKGIECNININVNSRGIFSCKLPVQVAEDLRIKVEHTSLILHELEKTIKDLIESYKNSATTYEIFILIAYQARGKYIERKDGSYMFGHNDDKYKIDVSFSEIDNAIGLDFIVAIEEVIDGKSEWFRAKKDDDGNFVMPDKFTHSNRGVHISRNMLKRAKKIPYTKEALKTLLDVQEKFCSLSELLFNFIKKDEQEIQAILISNKLLN
jgi:hypothetical protein